MSDYEHHVPGLSDSEGYTCGHCGGGVDPLRAARVRLFADRFYYFCSSECANLFDPREQRRSSSPHPPHPVLVPADDEPLDARSGAALFNSLSNADPPDRVEDATGRPTPSPPASSMKGTHAAPRPLHAVATTGISERLLFASLVLAALSLILLLAEDSLPTTVARTAFVGFSAATLSLKFLRFRDALDTQPWLEVLWVPLLAVALAIASVVIPSSSPQDVVAFAATTLLNVSATLVLLRRLESPLENERQSISGHLDGLTSRIRGEAISEVDASQLRPGEEIVIHAGETVLADVTLVAGKAEIFPWLGAPMVQHVRTGDFVFAGAKLASGQVRATVRWHGLDRHWLRLTHDPGRRADLTAPLVLFARKVAWRGAAASAAAAVAAGFASSWSNPMIALSALAAAALMNNPALHRLPALRTAAAVLHGLKLGIVYKSSGILEAASRASTAVFCARGTLLLGEPELSSIDALSDLSENEVLSLVAGAEQVGHHPVAVAVQRAARAHDIRPDAVRSPNYQVGLGVTAVTSMGQPLVVGSRALMLRERISVAKAESRITELEAAGRTVLLIACNQRLVGILALQDGLRAGARAAVQRLLDVGIEPVLLSGDSRETCSAVGRTIDIDHVRPDVLPGERGIEVERLRSGGANVAVVGRSPTDDIALSAASVSVALPGPGNTNGDFDIELAGDEVQKAALALCLAHDCGRDALKALIICAAGGTAGVLALLGLGLPAAWVPLLALGLTAFAASPFLTHGGLSKPAA